MLSRPGRRVLSSVYISELPSNMNHFGCETNEERRRISWHRKSKWISWICTYTILLKMKDLYFSNDDIKELHNQSFGLTHLSTKFGECTIFAGHFTPFSYVLFVTAKKRTKFKARKFRKLIQSIIPAFFKLHWVFLDTLKTNGYPALCGQKKSVWSRSKKRKWPFASEDISFEIYSKAELIFTCE